MRDWLRKQKLNKMSSMKMHDVSLLIKWLVKPGAENAHLQPEGWHLYRSSEGREWLFHNDLEWFFVEQPGDWTCYRHPETLRVWWVHNVSGRWFWN